MWLRCQPCWARRRIRERKQTTEQTTEQGADEATDQDADAEGRVVVARVNGQPIYEDQIQPDVQKMLASDQKFGMRGNADQTTKRIQLARFEQQDRQSAGQPGV